MAYSFAQNMEDVLLWRCFAGRTEGFYIDIGAAAPIGDSVTASFYERGWHGINVEPIPERAEELRFARPRDITIEAAIAGTTGSKTLYRTTAAGALSSLTQEFLSERETRPHDIWPIAVATMPLSAVFDMSGGREVQFLKIDVEGAEETVLRSGDFSRHRPEIVLLEAVQPSVAPGPNHTAWEPLLLESGYQLAFFDGVNRYYVRQESADLRRHFAVPVNVLDGYRSFGAMGNAMENRQHPDHEFAIALAHKLLRFAAAGRLPNFAAVFKRDFAPAIFAEPIGDDDGAQIFAYVLARQPTREELSALMVDAPDGEVFLNRLLMLDEFRSMCARASG